MNAERPKLKKRPRGKQMLPTECLDCGCKDGYKEVPTTQEIEFRGEFFSIDYNRMECPECKAAIMSDEQIVSRSKKTVTAYQLRHGLLTAATIVSKRKALGFNSQRDFLNAAPELKEATLKRLEAGQRVQDNSTDCAIKLIIEKLETQRLHHVLTVPFPQASPSETIITSTPQIVNLDCASRKLNFSSFAQAACFTLAVAQSIAPNSRLIRDEYPIDTIQIVQSC